MSFKGRSGKFKVIENDNLGTEEFTDFIDQVVENIKQVNAPNYYIWCNWKFYGLLQKQLPFDACIVWAKNGFGLGRGYRHQHEFCLFHGKIDEDVTYESDLWLAKKDHKYKHPTQKPVELSYRALCNHKTAMNVMDLFGGSGSTLVGCQHAGRNAFVMEYNPKYCDLIIKRWEKMTGLKAVKEADNGC